MRSARHLAGSLGLIGLWFVGSIPLMGLFVHWADSADRAERHDAILIGGLVIVGTLSLLYAGLLHRYKRHGASSTITLLLFVYSLYILINSV